MGQERDRAIKYISRFIGTFYIYGGDDPSGFDCSGIVHEFLQSEGLEEHGLDSTAHDLYIEHFVNKKSKRRENPIKGCLIFWLRDGKAYHVAIAINEDQVITASGGTSATKSIADAIRQNAFIKVRPLDYRGDFFVKICDPFDKDKNHV